MENTKEIKYKVRVEEIFFEEKKKFKLNKVIIYVYSNSFDLFLAIYIRDKKFTNI